MYILRFGADAAEQLAHNVSRPVKGGDSDRRQEQQILPDSRIRVVEALSPPMEGIVARDSLFILHKHKM